MMDFRTCGGCTNFVPDAAAIVPGKWFAAWYGKCAEKPAMVTMKETVNNFCESFKGETDVGKE